jgi:hypothetical protein
LFYVDDLSRSVLDDPVADAGHLALVEISRTVLYVYRNPGAVVGEGSPIVAIIMQSLGRAVKEMYVTMADKLRAEGRKEGRAAARADSVLGVLRYRLGPVPAAVRKRVLATGDERLLRRWFHRALTWNVSGIGWSNHGTGCRAARRARGPPRSAARSRGRDGGSGGARRRPWP